MSASSNAPEPKNKGNDLGTTSEPVALMRKADPTMSDARLLQETDRNEAAVNRMYYTAIDAARAAVLIHGEAPSSHAGVKTRFGYHFVRTGLISRPHARTLAEAEAMRNRADYDAFSAFEVAPTTDLLNDVAALISAIRSTLDE